MWFLVTAFMPNCRRLCLVRVYHRNFSSPLFSSEAFSLALIGVSESRSRQWGCIHVVMRTAVVIVSSISLSASSFGFGRMMACKHCSRCHLFNGWFSNNLCSFNRRDRLRRSATLMILFLALSPVGTWRARWGGIVW